MYYEGTDELYKQQVRAPGEYPVNSLVMAHQLKFPLDKMWPSQSNFFERWIARRAAARILNSSARTYQFGGWTGAKKLAYELVDADKEQIAHWLLREVGYSCCPADIMKLTGHDPECKP